MKKNRRVHDLIFTIMRITVIQCFLAYLFVGITLAYDGKGQSALSQKITLDVENQQVKLILRQLEKQSNVRFVFSSKLIQSDRKATIKLQNSQLSMVLDALLKPLNLSYQATDDLIVIKPEDTRSKPVSLENGTQTLDRTISGVVKEESGVTLPGVSIVLKGTQTGSLSDENGKYSLSIPNGTSTLIFSFVGFVSQEVEVSGNQSSLNITLKPDNKSLSEVVVVGYGTQRREQITSAIASVKSESFVKGAVQDAAQLIRGKVAGLSVITPDGNPTSTSQITLRGNATIKGNASPLVLIDGVPGSLTTVAPDDIESIDVLKDGSAAAIYGTRGTNGVILITTRKVNGEIPPTLDISTYFTTQRQTRQLDFMNAYQYRKLVSEKKPGALDYGANTDWLKHVTQTPLSQVYNISLKGGTRSTNYIMSMEYRNLNGVLKKSDNSLLYPRIEINHTMFDGILKFNANISGYQQKHFAVDGGSYSGFVYRNALTFNPTEPLRDASGKWSEHPEKTDYMNPVGLIEESKGLNQNNNLRTYGTVTLAPIKDLAIKALFSRDMYNSTRGY